MIGVIYRVAFVLIPGYSAAYWGGSMIWVVPTVAASVLAVSYWDKNLRKVDDDVDYD